jgi:peptidoglycan lytic transglycosylase G
MDQPTPRRAAQDVDRRGAGKLIVFLLMLGLVVAGVYLALGYYQGCKEPPDGPARNVGFTVRDGATGEEVLDHLHRKGLVSCGGFVGNAVFRATGKSEEILTGTYTLTHGMTLDRIVEVLTTPPPEIPTVRLTIPPGFRLTEIADRVEDVVGIPSKRFLQRVNSGDFALPGYVKRGRSLEGFLFPETYRIPKAATADEVIRTLLDQFAAEVKDLPWSNAGDLGMTRYEIVVVASMIEEEAAVDQDRPLIAGVIYNRLSDGITLGIDATLLYDDPTPETGLTTSDLGSDSPYNTRINQGLPPTPIASPYLWSIERALEPAETEFYYYVLCAADGSHRFAVTLDEHNRNVDECL